MGGVRSMFYGSKGGLGRSLVGLLKHLFQNLLNAVAFPVFDFIM